jgi:hypothetical protein
MKLPNLKLLVTTIFTLGVMTSVNAQQAKAKPQENSLLAAALKKSQESPSKSLSTSIM